MNNEYIGGLVFFRINFDEKLTFLSSKACTFVTFLPSCLSFKTNDDTRKKPLCIELVSVNLAFDMAFLS